MNEMQDAALSYAALGWRVFPLLPRSKEPATAHGFKDATCDAAQIRRWWGSNPSYNVGIATGSGLCVVDVDDKPDKHPVLGSDMLREWEYEHAPISDTCSAISGTGGVHYYFDVGGAEVPSCQSDTIFIDLRCEGGYIVAPPSIHPDTGKPYVWEYAPEDVPPAKASANDMALIDWIYSNRKGAKQDGTHQKAMIPDGMVKEGEGRNRFLYEQGCSARAKGSDDEMVEVWLGELNKKKCSPPLDGAELRKIVRSVCSKPVGLSDEAKAASEHGKSAKMPQHVSVAYTMLEKYSACFLDGAPAVYDGITYNMGWTAVERAILNEWPGSTDKNRKEVCKYLSITMPRQSQSNPRYIGFLNGVLDIETMELLSFSPDLKIPNVIPHNWNPDAQSDLLDATLAKIACGDPAVENNLCEFIGLCMYRSGKYAFSAILLGKVNETASNGKSTYIDLIRNVLGKGNYSSLSLQDLGGQYSPDLIAGKLANLGDDISSEFTKGKALEVFKKACSGTEIHTDIKYSTGYDFTPYCTMIFSANVLPKMDNLDDGTIRRLFPIRFNAHFTASDPDFDPDIGEKLKAEEVAEAAIVRGVAGLKRVIKNRRPTDNEESVRMVRDIKVDNSNILQWIEDEAIQRDMFLDATVGLAYESYDDWCSKSGVTKKFAKWQFSKEMCSYFGYKVKNTTRNGKGARVFDEAN